MILNSLNNGAKNGFLPVDKLKSERKKLSIFFRVAFFKVLSNNAIQLMLSSANRYNWQALKKGLDLCTVHT